MMDVERYALPLVTHQEQAYYPVGTQVVVSQSYGTLSFHTPLTQYPHMAVIGVGVVIDNFDGAGHYQQRSMVVAWRRLTTKTDTD